jgi:hypothetical protein
MSFVLAPFPLFLGYVSIVSPADFRQILFHPLKFFQGDDSSITHGVGLLFGFRSVLESPMGNGTGSGGNFANIFELTDRNTWIQSGSESSFGTLSYQLGVIGLFLFFFSIYLLHKQIIKYEQTQNIDIYKFFGIFVGWFASSFFSENAIGPASSFLPLTIAIFFIYSPIFKKLTVKRHLYAS